MNGDSFGGRESGESGDWATSGGGGVDRESDTEYESVTLGYGGGSDSVHIGDPFGEIPITPGRPYRCVSNHEWPFDSPFVNENAQGQLLCPNCGQPLSPIP